ncbi:hypothetical protein [Flavobacterium lindanitolerans]|uniref:hypothetical protein n=1 Tax=Flavobacterium lindanitolerans TaxID=428988 RepID=UPI0028093358|nr:hypothetical protein [Flavobacterium lindanitolerans]MDQ7959138.1 hypothetical protein [Flavobacterium lindanitolerans]
MGTTKTIYQSDRNFRIWNYTVSHCSLLLRSIMSFPDLDDYSEETSYNIDIEISGVSFIGIPTTLRNLKIKEISEDLLPGHIDKELCKYDLKIFEFEEENERYYIIAAGLMIATNKWDLNQDRILSYHLGLQHDKIIITA